MEQENNLIPFKYLYTHFKDGDIVFFFFKETFEWRIFSVDFYLALGVGEWKSLWNIFARLLFFLEKYHSGAK